MYFFLFLYFSCVPGFSNFVFRVLVFRRSGIPAFRVLVQAVQKFEGLKPNFNFDVN